MKYQEFHDFDAFAESIRDMDSRMMLINPRQHFWSSSALEIDGVDIQFGKLGSGNLGQAELRSGGFLFYLPLTSGIRYAANGLDLSTESFAVVNPGSEFCISTTKAHDWCAAFVPTEILDQHLVDLHSSLKGPACRLTRPNPQAVNQFRKIVFQTMKSATNYSDFESTAAARVAAKEFLKAAVLALGQRETDDIECVGRPKIPRQLIIRRCMDFLEHSAANPVTGSDLAAAASVSEVTLRTAFREYFGIGPNRYLSIRQLHQVHRALLRSDPDGTSVSKVLFDHGVWELGRFASRHRKLFGELPCETLRR